MQISNETIQFLKNFASINTNILVRKGKTISTISTAKNIFAKATVVEDFPVEVPIYDLNSLLALLTLMENQDVTFGDKSLTISKNGGKFEYFYSNPSVIVSAPDKNIELDNHFQFKLTAEDVQMIVKAAAITAAPTISVVCKHQQVILIVGDKKNDTANTYRKVIGPGIEDFECHIAVENFKIIPDAYSITVSKKKFFHFRHETKSLEYFIAMEPDSVV
ncbi:MAG: DNA polymerase [Proteobacteria bacterium]|nr:DNA polymerase [Pseudomonadota bacterium]NBP14471.1 DNA polymerase [bacterium]